MQEETSHSIPSEAGATMGDWKAIEHVERVFEKDEEEGEESSILGEERGIDNCAAFFFLLSLLSK